MLLSIRDKVTGWIAYVIVILIAIPFALWGIQQYFGAAGAAIVAVVGDVEIDAAQLDQGFLQRKRQLEESLGEDELPPDSTIKSVVLSEMMSRELLDQAVASYGYDVSDDFLSRIIMQREEFHEDGRFDPKKYEQLLGAQRISRSGFEDQLRLDLRRQQFYDAVRDSNFLLDSEQKRYDRLLHQERKIRYAVINTNSFIEPESLGGEAARAEYDANRENYKSPLKVRLRYVELNMDEMMEKQVVDEDQARTYYEADVAEFLTPERRRVRHILVATWERSDDEAAARADEAYRRLLAGEDFAEIAMEYSDDDLSAETGGELLELTAADIEEDTVRDAVFGLEEGEFSEPVASDFGLQIFQLMEAAPEYQKTFEEVREELIEDIRAEQAQEEYVELAESLDALAFERAELFFEDVSSEFNLKSKLSPWLEDGREEDLFAHRRVRELALTTLLNEDQANSGLVEVEPGHHAFVFAIESKQQPKQLEFDEVQEDIVAALLSERATKAAKKQHDAWMRELRSGVKPLDAVAEDGAVDLEDLGYVERRSPLLPPQMVELVFTMEAPSPGRTAYSETRLHGDNVIIELAEVRDSEVPDSKPVSFAGRELQAVVSSLKSVFEINVFPENIQ